MIDSRQGLKHAAWALGLLAFIQLYTLYVESIYRMSLIKLAMGVEMLGVAFLLAPLVIIALGQRAKGLVIAVAVGGMLVARIAAPYSGVRAQIAIAGFGVACFLLLFAYAMANDRIAQGVDWAGALSVAVVVSVFLRHSWWTTLDWSMEPSAFPVSLVLLGLLGVSAWVGGREPVSAAAGTSLEGLGGWPRTHGVLAGVVVFVSLTLVYLVSTSPAVTSAWSGGSYRFAVSVTAVAWAVALYLPPPRWPALMLWNTLLAATLVWGILANRVILPLTPDEVVIDGADFFWTRHMPVYTALALSPVLAWNVRAGMGAVVPLRRAAAAVFVGMLFMFMLTLMVIFSNVWGYVEPVSGMFRNRFHVPFLVAGVAILVALLGLRGPLALSRSQPAAGWARGAATVIAALVLVWMGLERVMDSRNLLGLRGHVHGQGQGETVATVTAVEADIDFRVLTYNMQQGSDLQGDRRYIEQLRFVQALAPDLILLQESDTPRPSGGHVDAPRLFADALGLHLYYGPKTVTGTFGTAILSRVPLEHARTLFTYSDADEVGTAVAEINIGGRTIAVFNNHPAGSDSVKHAHVDAMLEHAAGYDFVISGGDFNFRQDSPYYGKVSDHLRDTWSMRHADALGDTASVIGGDAADPERFDMTRRIDHVFVSDGFEVVEAQYILPPESITDHPAYWCTLRW